MSQVRQRRKGISSSKTSDGSQKVEKHSDCGTLVSPKTNNNWTSFWMDSRTSFSIISLSVCLVLSWFLFQQSGQFADIEKKYSFLQQEAEKFLDVENKVNLISEKLESTESILREAASSISVMTEFEQDISSLHNIINDIQNNEQTLSIKMQSINEKFQNVTNSWRRSLDEMNTNTSGLKSEAKFIHTEVTSQINEADQRIKSLSERCEKAWNLMEQLEDLQIISHIKHLQEDIYTMKTWSSSIIKKQEELQKNLTTLFQAVSSVEQNAASVAKNITLMIVTVKTDIRRISGLVSDMTALTDSLQTLEDKVEKGEKKTVKNIGDLLTSSIDRSTKLQSLASSNGRRIEHIKTALSELRSDFNKHSDRLLNLEGDRAKVLKTVTFANDLKPKMYKLRKDFAILEPLINDLTLRIGRLVEDVLRREKEIALLNEKLANLTRVQTEIKDMKDEITKISDMN
ncbi:inhibitor of nuclear factor kappa-B kinase-interacting protein isoform X1 [Tyto alba]|uniref:inhibitor of nuclear factor kappa-B kinase-interacting protein isoform X1 n=1 Tax=Tyto alba TaxID=56313 RepID=UPI00140261A2|nr:inhibitor of nuclear factor kappa-B kinase-interacting protein isoform X1 [Tyto alba]